MASLLQCAVCGSNKAKPRFTGYTHRDPSNPREWPVVTCDQCGHGYISPRPSREVLDGFYSKSYEAYSETHGSSDSDRVTLEEAQNSGEFRHLPLPQGKRILDFGCGGGYFLRICKALGAQTFGIEPSIHGANLVRKQGLDVFHGSIDDYMSQVGPSVRQFDQITANHVLEHTEDPVSVLRSLGSLLAPGGTLWISVPNAASYFANALGRDWHSFDLPYHLHHFSPQSLELTGKHAGLKIKRRYTYSLPGASAASHRLLWRRRYFVPQRVLLRLPVFETHIAFPAAKRFDSKDLGEAIICEFVS